MPLPPVKRCVLSGWGKTRPESCLVFRPEKCAEAVAILRHHPASLAVRGQGRGCGDAAVNAPGTIVTARLDRFLSFDVERGVLVAQSGVTLADVLSVAVPRGWLPPVLPDMKQVSLGGCVAADVHGKNQWRQGNFGRHVLSLTLLLPDGRRIGCSREQEADLFHATIGGLGLTGLIEEVTLQLARIHSATLEVERVRVQSVAELMDRFRARAAAAEYMCGALAQEGGVFEAAKHADVGAPLSEYRPARSRFHMPPRLAERLRMAGASAAPESRTRGLEAFFFDRGGIAGPLQYQCMVPEGPEAATQLDEVFHAFHTAKVRPYRARMHYHAPAEGFISFAGHGFSLTLDIPATARAYALLDVIDDRIARLGGKVCLGGDARLAADSFERMYAEQLPRWRGVVNAVDPARRMHSSLSARLNLRGPV